MLSITYSQIKPLNGFIAVNSAAYHGQSRCSSHYHRACLLVFKRAFELCINQSVAIYTQFGLIKISLLIVVYHLYEIKQMLLS